MMRTIDRRSVRERVRGRKRVFNSFLHAAATGCRSHTRPNVYNVAHATHAIVHVHECTKIVPRPWALVLEPAKKVVGLMTSPRADLRRRGESPTAGCGGESPGASVCFGRDKRVCTTRN